MRASTAPNAMMTRRRWRQRCLRRDLALLLAWIALPTVVGWALRTHAAVVILKPMFKGSVVPGVNSAWGTQIIYMYGDRLSEEPGPQGSKGGTVNWSYMSAVFGDPAHPFFQEATFTIGAKTPTAPGVTEGDIEEHIQRYGIWLPIAGDLLRQDKAKVDPERRIRESRHVAEEHPENVLVGLRSQWPLAYSGAWGVFLLGLTALIAWSRSG